MNKQKVVRDFFTLLENISAQEYHTISQYHILLQEVVIENQKNGADGTDLFRFDETEDDCHSSLTETEV